MKENKGIEVHIRFWGKGPKQCLSSGTLGLVPDKGHGIARVKAVHFQSLPDLIRWPGELRSKGVAARQAMEPMGAYA
jgi:hypothetical protein